MSAFEAGSKEDDVSVPPFLLEKHVAYVKCISNDKASFEFTASQHFRMVHHNEHDALEVLSSYFFVNLFRTNMLS